MYRYMITSVTKIEDVNIEWSVVYFIINFKFTLPDIRTTATADEGHVSTQSRKT